MRHPPQSAKPTHVLEWDAGRHRRILDELAGEEPLEIRVGDLPIGVTMRTPGDDFQLAAGLLFTEGLITAREQVATISYGRGADGEVNGNVVNVAMARAARVDLSRVARHSFVSSSCGICGKVSIERIRAQGIEPPRGAFEIDPRIVIRLPGVLRSRQRIFGRTGGLHAAALFDEAGELLDLREDIGRHNAVDKIIGNALLANGTPLSNRVLMVSGRGGFEIVQKALVAGVPIVACVSAPSSLAVQLARDFGLTLIGFVRGTRFVVYSGEQRLTQPEAELIDTEQVTVLSGAAGRRRRRPSASA